MIYSNSWQLVFLLFIGLMLRVDGQPCPTVQESLADLYATAENEEGIIKSIRENCKGANDSLSLIFHKRSVYAYSSEQDLEASIHYALLALAAQRVLYADGPAIPLGKSLANLGLFYRLNGQYSLALPYLQEANLVFTQLNNYSRRHNNQQQLIKLWHATGDLGPSDALLKVMLTEAREAINRPDDQLSGLVAEAETLRLQGEQANQAREYATGLPAFAAAAEKFATLNDLASLLMTYMGQGRAYFHLQRYVEARTVTEKALALAKDFKLDYDKAVMYNLLALTYKEEGDIAAGRRSLASGEAYAIAYGGPEVLSTFANTSASLATKAGKYQQALVENTRAIAYVVNGWQFSEETPVPSPDQLQASEYKQLAFEFLMDRVKILSLLGDKEGALEVVRAADLLADVLRMDFGGQVSKLFWRREALPLYEAGVRLSEANKDTASVFYFLERSRSILLLEALLREDVQKMIDPQLSRQLAEADYDVKQKQRDLLTAAAGEKAPLRLALLAASDTLSLLREKVANRYPGVRQRLLMPELVNLNEARLQLKEGEWDRQIHYLFGEESVYAFSLTATQATTYHLGSAEEIGALVRELITYYTQPTAIDGNVQNYLQLSQQVYKVLLSPMGIARGEQLLIVPDGLLAYLPFAALVTEEGAQDLGNAAYLLRRNVVSYAPSATVLGRQMNGITQAPKAAFAFAPFVTGQAEKAANPLPFSEEEVQGLASHYREDVVMGNLATKDTLLAAAPLYRILHLSTHAFASMGAEEPARILTATAPLYLADLYGLRLTAELVTLSACQSNIGPLARGEGVLGLGRAFTAAGAKGVVASLWSLNDRATMQVMTNFYKQLAAGKPKPLALHAAQLEYLERTDVPAYLKSPYYWAGFTYYGDAGKLPGRSLPVWIWGVVVAGLLLGLYLLLKKTSGLSSH